MTNQRIRLRKKIVDKLFPNPFTKMREEDFLSKAMENKSLLNKREFDAMTNIKGELHDAQKHFEFYAKKRKGGIELIPFD